MRRAPPAFHDLGRRLLAHEAGIQAGGAQLVVAAEVVLLKLQARLAVLFGQQACERLLARALHLARSEHPLLKSVTAEPPTGSPPIGVHLRGLREAAGGSDRALVPAALAALIGTFIWLLVTFVGQSIVWRELRRMWPALPFPEPGPGAEEGKL